MSESKKESLMRESAAAEDAQQLFEPSFCLPLKGQDTFRERERARERTSGKRYFLANRKESAAAVIAALRMPSAGGLWREKEGKHCLIKYPSNGRGLMCHFAMCVKAG